MGDAKRGSLVLGRRQALVGMTTLTWACSRPRSATPAATLSSPSCVLTPEQVEGPYYLDDARLRSDLREDRPGVPLVLEVSVLDVRSCAPVTGAAVDIWHCDASGVYSGFVAESTRPPRPFGPPPGGMRPLGSGSIPAMLGPPRGAPPAPRPTDEARFLRGTQLSDGAGRVRFTTIYPGWYSGRTVHVHVRVRTGGALRGDTYGGGHAAHTGQLYFPEALSDRVFTAGPYASHQGTRLRQADDPIFNDGDSSGLLSISPMAAGSSGEEGYEGAVALAIDPTASPAIRR
jgi:protocatechuate 3,4-dioxygenase beta subunit